MPISTPPIDLVFPRKTAVRVLLCLKAGRTHINTCLASGRANLLGSGICRLLYEQSTKLRTQTGALSHLETECMKELMAQIFSLWPKTSGAPEHPVPAPDSPLHQQWIAEWELEGGGPPIELPAHLIGPVKLYRVAGFKATNWTPESGEPHPIWEGEYGELRRELLNFCIEWLSAYLTQRAEPTQNDLNSDESLFQ